MQLWRVLVEVTVLGLGRQVAPAGGKANVDPDARQSRRRSVGRSFRPRGCGDMVSKARLLDGSLTFSPSYLASHNYRCHRRLLLHSPYSMANSKATGPGTDADMSKGDVESIGAHCQMEYCHVLDFLPFPCMSCKGYV